MSLTVMQGDYSLFAKNIVIQQDFSQKKKKKSLPDTFLLCNGNKLHDTDSFSLLLF